MQSPNISNECTLGIEKYVRNVVSDVVSSHGGVVNNGVSMLWSGRNTISWSVFCKLTGRCFEKNGKRKSNRHWLTNTSKDTCISEISSTPYDANWVCEGCPVPRKGEEIISDFELRE